jgi:hypothetical protein
MLSSPQSRHQRHHPRCSNRTLAESRAADYMARPDGVASEVVRLSGGGQDQEPRP